MKKIFLIIAIFVLIMSHSMMVVAANNEIKVNNNGRSIDFDVKPVVVNSRTLVPVRAIFEAMDFEVIWDGRTSTVTGNSEKIKVSLKINDKLAFVNGKEVELDVPAQIQNGRTLVPVRFIAESTGANVEWDGVERTVEILSEEKDKENYARMKENISSVEVPDTLSEELQLPTNINGVQIIWSSESDYVSGNEIKVPEWYDVDAQIQLKATFRVDNLSRSKIYEINLNKALYTGEARFEQEPYTKSIVIYPKEGDGFSIPYIIWLPKSGNETENSGYNRFLFLEQFNSPYRHNDFDAHLEFALENRENTIHSQVSEALNIPRITPVLPRLSLERTDILDGTDSNGFDKTIITLKENIERIDPNGSGGAHVVSLTTNDLEKYYDIEEQYYNIIVHATELLNNNGYDLEEQIFVGGFSAAGTFANRFATIYPEIIKAVHSGGNFIPMMPAGKYNGVELDYQIGVNEHKALFDKEFDLELYNDVAKIMYLGGAETKDPLSDFRHFTADQSQVIRSLYGNTIMDRWENAQDTFFDVGGKGTFITSKYSGHNMSQNNIDIMINFFEDNRNSDKPDYSSFVGHPENLYNINNEKNYVGPLYNKIFTREESNVVIDNAEKFVAISSDQAQNIVLNHFLGIQVDIVGFKEPVEFAYSYVSNSSGKSLQAWNEVNNFIIIDENNAFIDQKDLLSNSSANFADIIDEGIYFIKKDGLYGIYLKSYNGKYKDMLDEIFYGISDEQKIYYVDESDNEEIIIDYTVIGKNFDDIIVRKSTEFQKEKSFKAKFVGAIEAKPGDKWYLVETDFAKLYFYEDALRLQYIKNDVDDMIRNILDFQNLSSDHFRSKSRLYFLDVKSELLSDPNYFGSGFNSNDGSITFSADMVNAQNGALEDPRATVMHELVHGVNLSKGNFSADRQWFEESMAYYLAYNYRYGKINPEIYPKETNRIIFDFYGSDGEYDLQKGFQDYSIKGKLEDSEKSIITRDLSTFKNLNHNTYEIKCVQNSRYLEASAIEFLIHVYGKEKIDALYSEIFSDNTKKFDLLFTETLGKSYRQLTAEWRHYTGLDQYFN